MSEQLIETPSVFGETGNFLLERELGRGGMGGVYMGRDKMLDRPVAVKVMLREYGEDSAFVEKFKKEAQAAAKLIHPNIAQVYSYGIADGMPYMAMELVAGGSLYQMMNTPGKKTDIQRVLKIGEQVAQALRCASDQGLVHGDVKPENILLDANGNAKLVDFGLAGMQRDTDEIWGTPYYIAPEKVKKEPVDFRADMYNLGGTLYHALTGVAPFEGTDSNEVVKKRFETEPRRPSELRPEITPQVDDLIMKMLAFDPEGRFPSFEALLEEFKFVLSNGLNRPVAAHAAGGGGKKKIVLKKNRTRIGGDAERPRKVRHSYDAEEEEEDEGGSVAGKVLLVVFGVIALIGAVVGGLIWYKVSSENKLAAEERAQIAGKIAEARAAIGETRATAAKFALEVEGWMKSAIDNAQLRTDNLKKKLPAADAKLLKPAPVKELLDAIASTNEVKEAAAEEPVKKPSADSLSTDEEEKPKKKVHQYKKFRDPTEDEKDRMSPEGQRYLEEKKAWDEEERRKIAEGILDPDEMEEEDGEEVAAKEKAEEDAPKQRSKIAAKEQEAASGPASEFAVTIKDMNALWTTAYEAQAAAIRTIHRLRKLDKFIADGLATATGTDEATMNALAALSLDAKAKYDEAHDGKDAVTARSAPGKIQKRGDNIVAKTDRDIRERTLQADRDKKAKDEAESERARKAAQAAEKESTIKRECSDINSKFDALAMAGTFRLLDWQSAIRQLTTMRDEFKYAESQIVADNVILKVKMMKAVHDIFIQNCSGFVFQRSKLRLAEIKEVNEMELKIQKSDGSVMKVTWVKFYQQYHGNLNELIQKFIEKGRGTSKLDGNSLTLRNWAEAMMGAALTMRIICSDDAMAIPRGESIAKRAVAEFPAYLKYAEQIFPDISFEGVAKEEEE